MENSAVKKVLVVDDHEEYRQSVRQALKNFNVEIIEAKDGKEAVEIFTKKFKNERFDLITMDYLMPELDGAQTVIKIREIDKTVPIICISASIKIMRPQVKHFEYMYFLDKPLDSKQLIQIVEDLELG